jgi:anti-anti-sigma factor
MTVVGHLSLQVSADETGVVVGVCGEIDACTAPDLASCLEAAILGSDGDVVVDCGAIDFIDSSGLRALVVARATLGARGRDLRLVHVGPVLGRLLELTGLDDRLEDRGVPMR